MSNEAAAGATESPPSAVETFGYRQELKRSLSLRDLLVYGLVFIVPGAPISIFGIVYNKSAGMVPLVFIVGLVAMFFTAASYVTMSRAFPIAGSVYSYAGRVIGERVGFLAGWIMLLDYLLLPTLVYVACGIAIHAVIPETPKVFWVVGLVLVNAVINVLGIQTTARVSMIFLALQIAGIVAFMVMAAMGLEHGLAGAHLTTTPLFNPDLVTPKLIFGALSLAVLSFLGFDAISTLSEEAAGGATAVGRATFLSLALTAAIFVMLTYTACLFVLDVVAFPEGDRKEAAFYDIAELVGGHWLKWILTVPGVVFAGLPGALAAQVATARLIYSMSRDGKLPRALAHVSARHQVPDRAAMLVSAVSLVLGIALVNNLELLTSMVNFGALTGFLLLHVSVVVHALRSTNDEAANRRIVVASIGFLIIGYVLVNLNRTAMIVGISWLSAGIALLVWFALTGRSAKTPSLTSEVGVDDR